MKYHLIGDQGISMSGIKRYLQHLGEEVTGSDLKTGGHSAKNITKDIDVVVRSSAVNPGSFGWVEVEAAERLGIKVIKRSQLLGELTKNKRLIAISGMHGKTTVSTMAGLLLMAAGFDPTILIGERVAEFDNEVLKIGKSEWFVLEACEYDRSFLDFFPEILILTNIEEEHLDTYKGGISEIKETFQKYLLNVSDDGLVIACADDENVKDVVEKSNISSKIIYYGKSSEDYKSLPFSINIPGAHNRLNALAVVALGEYLKIDQSVTEKVLQNFKGAKRRFEYKGNYGGSDIIDDYGHHPTEISATVQALGEKYPNKKKVVVFWPHQYKRIKPFLHQFAAAFKDADEVILKPIFFVPGRDEKLDVSSEDLAKLIKAKNKNVRLIDEDKEIVKYLKRRLDNSSVLLTIGIPPVYKIAEKLIALK